VGREKFSFSVPHRTSSLYLQHNRQLGLSNRWSLRSPFRHSVTALAIDSIDSRYLLAGGSEGAVALYDLEGFRGPRVEISPSKFVSDRHAAAASESMPLAATGGHTHTVGSLEWFPIDSGIFISASNDGDVVVWDTNAFTPALTFSKEPGDMALDTSMSPVAASASHASLVAVGCKHKCVRLLDMGSGASALTLQGHKGSVRTVEWFPHSEHMLASGADDGVIRVWDVRKSGANACVYTLDMYSQSSSCRRIRTPRGGAVPVKGKGRRSAKRRAVGGTDISVSLVYAHSAPVTSLKFVSAGRYMISTGMDCSMRLWKEECDTGNFANTFAHYDNIVNAQGLRGWGGSKLAVCESETSVFGSMVYHPQCASGCSEIQPYAVHTSGGENEKRKKPSVLRGHHGTVRSCVFRSSEDQLYSGAEDGLILMWETKDEMRDSSQAEAGQSANVDVPVSGQAAQDMDAWSEDEDADEDFRF